MTTSRIMPKKRKNSLINQTFFFFFKLLRLLSFCRQICVKCAFVAARCPSLSSFIETGIEGQKVIACGRASKTLKLKVSKSQHGVFVYMGVCC